MKVYHMIVQKKADFTGESRKEYLSPTQGKAPEGYICIGVCGYHEEKKERKEKKNDYLLS